MRNIEYMYTCICVFNTIYIISICVCISEVQTNKHGNILPKWLVPLFTPS